MELATDKLLCKIAMLDVKKQQILALHFVQGFDIETTSFIMGVSKEHIYKDLEKLLVYIRVPFGIYFGDEEIIREVDRNNTEKLSVMLAYDGEYGKSEKELIDNHEHYADKMWNYLEGKTRTSRGQKVKKGFTFTDAAVGVLKKWWHWEVYVPKSLEEKDLVAYRNEVNNLIRRHEREIFLTSLECEGDFFLETSWELVFFYMENLTVKEIASLLEVERDEVFNEFEKARKRLNYLMGGHYDLESLVYTKNDDYLPEDKQLKNIVKLKFCQQENLPLPEDVLEEVLVVYRKNFGS